MRSTSLKWRYGCLVQAPGLNYPGKPWYRQGVRVFYFCGEIQQSLNNNQAIKIKQEATVCSQLRYSGCVPDRFMSPCCYPWFLCPGFRPPGHFLCQLSVSHRRYCSHGLTPEWSCEALVLVPIPPALELHLSAIEWMILCLRSELLLSVTYSPVLPRGFL
jgi:hypothetical protein